MKKYFSYIIILFLALAILLPILPASALEIEYPPVRFPGIPTPFTVTSGTDFYQYITYFFTFIVITAGIFGVITIVTSGLKILLAFGSPEAIAKERNDIRGVLMGIGLLFISVILLRTINPQLLNLSYSEDLEPGLYVVSNPYPEEITDDNPEGVEFWPQKDDEPNVDRNITSYEGYEYAYLFYKCKPGPKSKDLLVWVYNEYDYIIDREANRNNNPSVRTVTLKCKDTTTTPKDPGFHPVAANLATMGNENGNVLYIGTAGPGQNASGIFSFAWDYKEPGVYFYLTDNCTGISSYAQRQNGRIKAFDDNDTESQQALSFKNLDGSGPNEKYGVILTAGNVIESREPGLCTAPIITQQCQKIDITNNRLDLKPEDLRNGDLIGSYLAKAAYVLKVAPVRTNMPQVTLASNFYRTTLTGADIFGALPPGSPPAWRNPYRFPEGDGISNLNNLIRKKDSTPYGVNWFTSLNRIEASCRHGITCLKKLFTARGAYYVILYSKNDSVYFAPDRKCQIFTRSSSNMGESPLLIGGRDIYKMYIVPAAP